MLTDFMPDGIGGNKKEGGPILKFRGRVPQGGGEGRKIVGGNPIPEPQTQPEPPKTPTEKATELWGHTPVVTRTPAKKEPSGLVNFLARLGVAATVVVGGGVVANEAGLTPEKVVGFVRGLGGNAPTAEATRAPAEVAPTATEKPPTATPTEVPPTATAKPTEKPPTATVEPGPTRAEIAADVGVESISERSLIYEDKNGVIVGGFILDKTAGTTVVERSDSTGPGGAPGAFEYLREKIEYTLPVDWNEGGESALVDRKGTGYAYKMKDRTTGVMTEVVFDPKKPIFIVPVDTYEELGLGTYNNVWGTSSSFDFKESGLYIYTYSDGSMGGEDFFDTLETAFRVVLDPSLSGSEIEGYEFVEHARTHQGLVALSTAEMIITNFKQSFTDSSK